jgi:DNA primase
MRIPSTFIDDLLARIDIVDVVGKYVPIKKGGKDYSGCCPFHKEKTPSFTVSQPKQFYYCFGCGASGNAVGFMMAHEHLSFVEAIETLAQQAGLDIPYEKSSISPERQQQQRNLYDLLGNVAKFYQSRLKNEKIAIEYLKGRGLTGEICKQYGIGYAPDAWDALLKQFPQDVKGLRQTGMLVQKDDSSRYYDRFRGRIMFPIRDKRGRVIAFGGRVLKNEQPKYLNSPETTLFHKGGEVYGLYEVLRSNTKPTQLVVVEGYMDVVALAQHGVNNAVASLGTALSAQNLSKLFNIVPEIILCFDGDRAGRSAALRAVDNSLSILTDGKQLKLLFLPEGEDPDSLVRKEGREKFLERMSQSLNLSSMIIEHLLDQVDVSSVDGRARLIELSKQYLNKISSKIYQTLMLEELARYTRLDVQRLHNMLLQDEPVQKQAQSSQQKSLCEHAIMLLLKQPVLVSLFEAGKDFLALKDVKAGLLATLVENLKNRGPLNVGQILGIWQDESEAKILATLAAQPCILTEEEIEEELKDTVSQLHKQLREVDIGGLLAKARKQGLTGLTDAEREQIRDYLAQSGN